MATTWIRPTYAHKNKGSKSNKASIGQAVAYITDGEKASIHTFDKIKNGQSGILAIAELNGYVQNPAKTEANELVRGHECSPESAGIEFADSIELYELKTGRRQKDNSRLVYHIRQAFKPGEIDPRVANRIGYELALEFTGGEHAFVVATHTNTAHCHNHIIFNAINLNCDGKFKDPWFSGKWDVARISDKLCREYTLSVVEVKHGWSDPYNVWEQKQGITKEDKEPSKRKQLEEIITLCVEKRPKDFDQLLKYLEEHNCNAKRRGKNISIVTPFSKRPIRISSLSKGFQEHELKKRIAEMNNSADEKNRLEGMGEEKAETKNRDSEFTIETPADKSEANKSKPIPKPFMPSIGITPQKPKELQLIINIQVSMKATESVGYKRWVEKFNLEQMSQTLLFIERHQLSLGELENMANQKPKVLAEIKKKIEAADEKLAQISALQRHIGTYGKTKEVYKQYKQSSTPEQFKQENIKAVTDHEAAKSYFDDNGYGFGSEKNLPSIKELRGEYAKENAHKKSLWGKYHEVRSGDREIDNAWQNVKSILNLPDYAPSAEKAPKSKSPSM